MPSGYVRAAVVLQQQLFVLALAVHVGKGKGRLAVHSHWRAFSAARPAGAKLRRLDDIPGS